MGSWFKVSQGIAAMKLLTWLLGAGLVSLSVQAPLMAEEQNIVNFIKKELKDRSKCPREVVEVEKITQQVVAGTLYKMDVVLKGHPDNGPDCEEMRKQTTCHMRAIEVPWESKTEILWEDGTCVKSDQDFNNDPPIVGGHEEIKGDLNKEQQEVVDFIEGTFNGIPGGPIIKCTREIVSVDKFTQQVVAGTLYNVHLTTEGHPSNDASCGKINARTSCKMQVYDIPWESGKSIVWEESTCHNPDNVNDDQPIGGLGGGITEIRGDLNNEQQEVVDFIKNNFNGIPGGQPVKCIRNIVNVGKFTQQVVAGTLYDVDITIEGHESNDASCGSLNSRTTCTMQVLDVPWESGKSLLWKESTCDNAESFIEPPILGGHQEIRGDFTKDQQEVVDFIKNNFNGIPGGPIIKCIREILSVDKFTEQVVAGTLYNLDLTIKGHDSNDASCGRFNERTSCKLQVLDVPWEDGKSIRWEESTCAHPESSTIELPAPGSAEKVRILTKRHKDVVKFAYDQYSSTPGSTVTQCGVKKVVSTENFTEQTVAGQLYTFDIILDYDKPCPGFTQQNCNMKVYVDPAGARELQESRCN